MEFRNPQQFVAAKWSLAGVLVLGLLILFSSTALAEGGSGPREPGAYTFTGAPWGQPINSAAVVQSPDQPLVATVYVDDDFNSGTSGWNVDHFDTIQAGIDAVDTGGMVRVYPGVYSETASGRILFDSSGPYQFGLFIGVAKVGITIQGVDSGGTPITSFSGITADVTTNATNSFGYSGIWVEADDVTITGLRIMPNVPEDNKTIEVVGDNFTVKYCHFDVPAGGSIYFNDWRFNAGTNTSYVQSYTVEGNWLDHGTSVDLASGAGYSGPSSGRKILNNKFSLDTGQYWPAISFNGSGTGVPWFTYSVGGAVITGNQFSGGEQYIRARGTYDNTQFDWTAYWNSNTYDRAVAAGTPPPGTMSTYSYTSGPYTFNDVRRIGGLIQAAIDNAQPGDTVLVGAGAYVEDNILINKGLSLVGAGSSDSGSVIDDTGSTDPGAVLVIDVTSGNATVNGFRILTGQNLNGISAKSTSSASTITITNNYIEGWRTSANPTRSCGGDNFGLIAGYGSQAFLDFNHNQLLQGCSNAILLERHYGPTDVSYNSWDRGVKDTATDGMFVMNYGGPDITTLQKVSHNTIDLGGGTVFTNNERSTGVSFAASYTGSAGGFTSIEITDNLITNLKSYRRGIGLWNNSAAPGTAGGISNAVIERNTIVGNGAGDAQSLGIRLLGKVVNSRIRYNKISNVAYGVRSQAWNSHISTAADTIVMLNSFEGNGQAVDWQGSDALGATCNWWDAISGPTTVANPGGLGQPYNGTLTFSPWLMYGTDASADPGFQLPTSITVTAGGDVSAADNNYRSLANAIGCVQTGQTVSLSGTFNFGAPYAQASWALGNDAQTGPGYTTDDYEVDVPANANNVTLTAASLGAATIQGPGDVASIDLEGFLQFYNTGVNTDWTISNLRILDFDLGIGMFCCAGGPGDKYTGTTITNNLIRLAKDLKGASASGPEDFQNIGIHLAYGQNQTISSNTIEIPGDGDSNPASAGQDWWTYNATPGWLYASQVGLQSNTHGGSAYDGLQITGNTVKVLTAQSANPARIIGIWENGHANNSDVTVSNNQFLNLAGGNDPALNRQMAFRATSHSSASTTVTYSGNTAQGASMGFGPMNVSAGNQPIQMVGNTVANVKTGILLGQYETLHLTNNKLISLLGTGTGIVVPATATAAMDSSPSNVIGGFATGVQVEGLATIDNAKLVMNGTGLLVQGTGAGSITNSAIAGNSAFGVNNTAAAAVSATGNFWGSCDGPGPVGPGSGDKVSTNVAFGSWLTSPPAGTLQAMVDAAPAGGTIQLGSCTYGGATIDKPLTIRGVPGTIVAEGSPAFTVTANDVTIENLVIDGNPGGTTPKSSFPGIVVQAGVDNLVVQNTEITDWANGIEVAGNTTNLKIVGNWVHDNTANGLLIDSGVTVTGATGVINGNLFKANGANGVQNDGATPDLNVEYNSWGDVGGPTGALGDGVGGSVDYTPWTFAETYIDVNPGLGGDQYQLNVDESTSFNVELKLEAANLYGLAFQFTYDPTYLTFNGPPTFTAPWSGNCSVVGTPPSGTFKYQCFLTSGSAWNGGTVATFNFTANGTALTGTGPWTTYFDISHLVTDTNAGAVGGVKVFVNNAGFGAPSIPARDITDGNDGQIDIRGIAQYRGYVDLQGRTNDSGAGFQVFASSAKPGTAIANATSSSSGVYTSAYVAPNLLTIGTTYYLYVDRALYLPTTATSATSYTHSKALSTRPLTTVGTIVLLGGDANDNNVIDINDASCIGNRYNLAPTTCGGVGSADVNGDGAVNILDLVLMGGNYDLTFSPWTP